MVKINRSSIKINLRRLWTRVRPVLVSGNFLSATSICVAVLFLNIFYLEHPLHKGIFEDEILIPAKEVSLLFDLKSGLSSAELPVVSPYSHCGRNLAADIWSYWSILNLLVFFLTPAAVIIWKQILLQIIGGISFYFLVYYFTKDKFVSLLFGLEYSFLIIARFYVFDTHVYSKYCLLPLVLLAIIIFLKSGSRKSFIFLIFVGSQAMTTSYGHAVYVIPCAILFFMAAMLTFELETKFFRAVLGSILVTVFVIVGTSYWLIPLFSNIIFNIEITKLLEEIGLAKFSAMSTDFPKEFIIWYLPTFFYPARSQSIILFIPPWAWALLIVYILNPLRLGISRRLRMIAAICLCLWLFSHFFFDIIPLILPSASRLALGNIIRQLQLIHLFILLMCAMILKKLVERLSLVQGTMAFGLILLFSFSLGRRQYWGYEILSDLIYFELTVAFLFFAYFAWKKMDWPRTWRIIFPIFCFLLIMIFLGRAFLFEERRVIGWHQVQGTKNLSREYPDYVMFYPERYEVFKKQTVFLDELMKKDYLNYRTIHITRNPREDDGLLLKELCNLSGRKVPFGYFESGDRYINGLNGLVNRDISREFNLRNITLLDLPRAEAVLKLIGVKYLFGWERMDEPWLKLVGYHEGKPWLTGMSEAFRRLSKRYSNSSKEWEKFIEFQAKTDSYAHKDLFVYEISNPYKITFLADQFETITRKEIFKRLFVQRETPWLDKIVWLEEKPANTLFKTNEGRSQFAGEAHIVSESYSRIEIVAQTNKAAFLVVSMPWAIGVKAHVGGKNVKVFRAYGNLRALEIPSGKSKIIMRYIPYEVYAGIIVTALCYFFAWLCAPRFSWFMKKTEPNKM